MRKKISVSLDEKVIEQLDKEAERQGLSRSRVLENKMRVIEDRKPDFLMFKRLLFQVRDKAVTDGSYLYFLAGYFGIIPTPEDLKIPEKGCFKIEERD